MTAAEQHTYTVNGHRWTWRAGVGPLHLAACACWRGGREPGRPGQLTPATPLDRLRRRLGGWWWLA